MKGQVKTSALAVLDEGGILAQLQGRSGTTVYEILRSMWSGTTVGQHNATGERTRQLEGDRYRLAMIVAIQPQYAEAILGDVDGGLPQRCLWFSAQDATIPDEAPAWPDRICWSFELDPSVEHVNVADTIAAGIRSRHVARQRGDDDAGYEGHADLVRLKLAALVAAFNGRAYDITEADWHIAETIHERSNATRTAVEASIAYRAKIDERQRNEAAARRTITVEDATERRAFESAVRAVAKKAQREKAGPVSRSQLLGAIAGKHRALVDKDAVFAAAEQRGHITRAPDGDNGGERWSVGTSPLAAE